MHGLIKKSVEELLTQNSRQPDVNNHLSFCGECAAELEVMKVQASMLHQLRSPEEVGPAPGFYARVMQRIEEGRVYSMWSVLTEGPFGKWLAYSSLALALVVGTWVVGVEREDGHLGAESVASDEMNRDVPVSGDQQHQRDVVLVHFASYSQQPVQ